MKTSNMITCIVLSLFCLPSLHAEPDTLPPLEDGKVPVTFDELWRGFDPQAEPLEVEILDEQERDGVVLKTLRFRIGVFNGKRAMMAAVFGYPKGAENLPGLVHIHGGGQYAHWKPVVTMAQRGYATLSIAWAGRYVMPDVTVGPDEVKLFWDDKTEDPNYRLTTDWGGVDGYHAPCRYPGNNFVLNPPSDSSLDAVKSPRDSGWFYVTMGARRALSFLQQQPEVDANRLGVFGHSMGGKLSVMTAGSDSRVKAAVPSCGGVTDRNQSQRLPEYVTTLGDDVYLKRMTCPIAFQIPANDFHSEINDLQASLDDIKSSDWRITCAPHHNHMDTAEHYVLTHLWFDQHLKGSFELAETPRAKLKLTTGAGIPLFAVRPDRPDDVLELDVYYTEQGEPDNRGNLGHVVNRFWKHAVATRRGNIWVADIPTFDEEGHLWVYANATYGLKESISGVGYGYADYTADSYTLSSRLTMVTPAQKHVAGVKPTLEASRVIETFEGNWRKEWYAFKDEPTAWELKTHKVYSPMFKAPLGAKLVFDVRAEQKNHLAINVGKTWKVVGLRGGHEWQTIELLPSDMNAPDAADALIDWQGIKDLKFSGSQWKGARPQFRKLHWVEIPFDEMMAGRELKLGDITPVDGKTYLDFKYADVATGTWKLQMNSWLGSNLPFTHGGTAYEQGISLVAPSEINFYLGGKYKRLHTTALTGDTGSVGLQVYLDRELVYDSGLLEGTTSREIDVPIEGAVELQLIVTDGGNGNGGDVVAWADIWLQ